MPVKKFLCFFLLLSCFNIFANRVKPNFYTPSLIESRLLLKAHLFEFTDFSLPNINFSVEYFLQKEGNKSVSLDLGYNYYSVDENVKAKGYSIAPKILIYAQNNNERKINAFAFGIYYQKTFMNDYLKTTRNLPGLGNYYFYEKMKYQKIRTGISLERVVQFSIFEKIFAEIAYGIALVNFQTKVPERVSQNTFVNGLVFQKTYNGITPLFSTKVGYCF